MAHFAEIDSKGIVLRVLVVSRKLIESGKLGSPDNWIQTSYNTSSNERTDNHSVKKPLRKNYASKGYIYDDIRDAFIFPKPNYASWILNENTCIWVSPVSKPTIDKYKRALWDEVTQSWVSRFYNENRYDELKNIIRLNE